MKKRFYIDTETTGFSHSKNGIVQIGGIIDIAGEIMETVDIKVRPFDDDEIRDEALKIQGRTLEEVQSYQSPADAYYELESIMTKYVDRFDSSDKFHFIAYNSPFDNGMMRGWFKKLDDPYFGSWFHNPDICVMRIAGDFLSDKRPFMENFKLMTVAKEVGIEIEEDEAHDAVYDAVITRLIHRFIRGEY